MIGRGYVVRRDLFDITDRIKEIDPDYFIFYSYRYRRYEVHNSAQRGGTLALVLPYDRLDERALRLVRRTRRERAEELLAETERQNERARRGEVYRAVKNAERATERALSAM